MTFRSLFTAAALALLAAPVLVHAQEISAAEEQRLEALARENAEIYVPKSNVSIGFRVLNSGGKVNFGQLGSVAFDQTVAARSAGVVDRHYDNGTVRADALRADERDANNVQTSTPGGRYATFATSTDTPPVLTQNGDYLAYTPGLTRSWGYASATQVAADGRIGMSTYSATSEGAAARKKEGVSAGVEFQYVRIFSKSTQRLKWGMLAGITLNGINSKTSGEVKSTLNIRTDYYTLPAGLTLPAAPYNGPTYADYVNSSGTVVKTGGLETTTPLTAIPDGATVVSSVAGGATVKGIWQVKGSYLMMRFGPNFHAQLTERLGLNGSIGLAGAYAGTVYSVAESFEVPNLPGVLVGTSAGTQQSSATKFLSGYYADLNMEWTANDRTGLFSGLTTQKLGNYGQTLDGRTALIDLGSAVGIRAGVSIKF